MIEPTVGRIVYVWLRSDQKKEYAAIITGVVDNYNIAVTVFPPNNVPEPYVDVHINKEENFTYPYAEWMPYQKGQAQKIEQLEKQLKPKPTIAELEAILNEKEHDVRINTDGSVTVNEKGNI